MKDINLVVEAVKNTLNPEKIILFGSHAFGKQRRDSDLDIAVIQKSPPHLGQKANIFQALVRLNYNWDKEPDIHIFSEKEFEKKLKEGDLFVTEISKGKKIYAKS